MTNAAASQGDGRESAATTNEARTRCARFLRWIARAWHWNGHERQIIALVGKSALAAFAAWAVADDVMAATTPAFAPFSAVLIMQVTIYQSVLQALRYLGAVCAGVVLQGVFGLAVGTNLLSFGLTALGALAIGRWGALGSQGSQVATAAFFSYSSYITATGLGERWSQLGEIISLVAIGCVVGVVVNTVVFPPMRYRSAEYGIHVLAYSMRGLMEDIAPALREGRLEADDTGRWRSRAEQLSPLVDEARTAIRTARESTYYNPVQKLYSRWRHSTFEGYEAIIDALFRVTYQLGSVTRSFDLWHDGEISGEHQDFLERYGDLLQTVAGLTEVFTRVDEDHLAQQGEELDRGVEEGRERLDGLYKAAERGSLPLADPTQPYSLLLVEATRLMDELDHSRSVMHRVVDRARSRGRRVRDAFRRGRR